MAGVWVMLFIMAGLYGVRSEDGGIYSNVTVHHDRALMENTGRDYTHAVKMLAHVKSGSTYTAHMLMRFATLYHDFTPSDNRPLYDQYMDYPQNLDCPIGLADMSVKKTHCCVYWSEVKNCHNDAGERALSLPFYDADKHGEAIRACTKTSSRFLGKSCRDVAAGATLIEQNPDPSLRHVLMLIRDPRDVLVSMYYFFCFNQYDKKGSNMKEPYSYLKAGAKTAKHTSWTQSTALSQMGYICKKKIPLNSDEVLAPMKFIIASTVQFYETHYKAYHDWPHFQLIYYEDMRRDPVTALTTIESFYGYNPDPDMIRATVDWADMENMKKMQKDTKKNRPKTRYKPTNIRANKDERGAMSRKGAVEGWRTELTMNTQVGLTMVMKDRMVSSVLVRYAELPLEDAEPLPH